MKPIRSGDLRERLTIQQRTSTPDGQGGRDVEWSTLATVWAKVEPLSGTERVQAGAETAVVSHRVTVRYRSDFDASYRIVWRRRVLEITALVSPDARREWLVVDCAQAGIQAGVFDESIFDSSIFDAEPAVA